MLELILIFVAVVIGAVLFLASKKPDEFRVERSIAINAPREAVFPHMNNLEKGQEWSPWVEMEPDADYKFEGPKEGVGAQLSWDGKKTGKGKLEIKESEAPEHVRIRLEFYKPMQAVNTCEYILEPAGDQTKVIWKMYGPNNLMDKCMSLFMDCEKMCGDQFEQGLQNLKNLIEKSPESKAA